MTSHQVEQYRHQLRAHAKRLGGTVSTLTEQATTPLGGESGGGISNAPLHLGDVGSSMYAQELGATLLENEVYIRDEVFAALDRIDQGTYGRCENCGGDIPGERLEALPYARHCTPCASDLQTGKVVNMNEGRPEGWLGEPGHEGLSLTGSPQRVVGRDLGGGPGDIHAAGTPGGGTAVGGLAGTNIADGTPDEANLEQAMGSGAAEEETAGDEGDEEQPEAFAGSSGGAVGGTPANKRARGGKADKPPTTRATKKGTGKATRKKKSG